MYKTNPKDEATPIFSALEDKAQEKDETNEWQDYFNNLREEDAKMFLKETHPDEEENSWKEQDSEMTNNAWQSNTWEDEATWGDNQTQNTWRVQSSWSSGDNWSKPRGSKGWHVNTETVCWESKHHDTQNQCRKNADPLFLPNAFFCDGLLAGNA